MRSHHALRRARSSAPGSSSANSSPPMRAAQAGLVDRLGQHLAGAPQQRVAGRMAELVVDAPSGR